jgi:hypothetical protein
MNGDITRFTHRNYKHYTGVLKQQGRVDLDADDTEQDAIQKHLRQTEAKDVIGCCGAPKTGGGFKIGVGVTDGGKDLTISPGRMYAGGILCELEATPLQVRPAGGQEVQVQKLVVDGRRFEEGQWVELIADEGTETKLAQITGVDSAGKKLTLSETAESRFTRLRRIATYTTQPDYPDPALPEVTDEGPGTYLVYLDVWQRHISALEDPDIREVALGGPDTATRTKTVWQVKYKKVGEPENRGGVDCSQFGCHYWTPQHTSGPPVMAARAEPGSASENLCSIPPGAGYRRLENQLYRVEIHDGGKPYGWPRPSAASSAVSNPDSGTRQITVQDRILDGRPWQPGQMVELFSDVTDAGNQAGALAHITAVNESGTRLTLDTDFSDMVGQSGLKVRRVATFKWSRDNGSVAFSVQNFVPDQQNTVQQVRVKRLGRDEVLGLHQGNWVEVLGDTTELKGEPGTLAQITPNGVDESEREVTLSVNVAVHQGEEHPKVRRWDSDGAVAVEVMGSNDGWLKLEDGVQVKFDPSSVYETGDYWLVPARTTLGDVLWPRDETTREALFEARHGTPHQFCSLALVELDESGWVDQPEDCRRLFPPLTEIEVGGCCIRVAPGESIQQAIDTVIRVGGGCICLGTGVHRVNGPLRMRSARNLTLSGESTSSVLLMNGTGEGGLGGLVLQDCAHVSIEGLFVVGTDVAALVDVRADPEPSHAVVLRGLTMFNATESAGRPDPICVARLADADEVLIEDCRLVAEVGVLCLNGDRLPDVFGDRGQITVDFEDLDIARRFSVGDRFMASGVEITAKEFQLRDGTPIGNGFATVVEDGRAGGSGREIRVSGINLGFDFGGPAASELSLRFAHSRLDLNIEINGEFRNVDSFSDIDGQTIGGVEVSHVAGVAPGGGTQGMLTLSGTITSFAIGGRQLWIDDVTFSQEQPPVEIPPGWVRALHMRGVQVRYLTFGAWAVTAEDWLLERCDLRPLGPSPGEVPREDRPSFPFSRDVAAGHAGAAARPATSALRELRGGLLDDGLSELDARQLLKRIDDALSQEGHANAGWAVKAFLWRNCTVRATRLQGLVGLFAWWWMGGAATDNAVRAGSVGIFAAWVHQARWNDNQLWVARTALAFVGCHGTRIEDNHIRAATGLTNLTLAEVTGELIRAFLEEGARNYAVPSTDASAQAVLYMLLEEGVRVLDLGDLEQGAQVVIDATNLRGMPVLALVARSLYGRLSRFDRRAERGISAPAPIIALLLRGNDIEGSERCISLDNFITLGGLQVADNRLHAVTGQALTLNSSPYAVNVPTLIALWRAVFQGVIQAMPDLIVNTREATDLSPTLKEALVTLLEQLSALLGEWSTHSESFLEADLTVENNTIHSLRTAIESNLFDLTIRHNHVALQGQSIPNLDTEAIMNVLAESTALRPLAVAMREGASTNIARYGMEVMSDERLLDDREMRGDVAATLVAIGNIVSEPDLRDSSLALGDAFSNRDIAAVRERLPRFVKALEGLVNTHGIWVKGAGSRIVGNRVLGTADAHPNSWARGGMLLWTDDDSAGYLVLLDILRQIRQELEMGEEPLPLIGAAETLIDSNEVLGGVGHGISIREMILGSPEVLGSLEQETLGFEDLRGFRFRGVGEIFSTSGVRITTKAFSLADGQVVTNGSGVVQDTLQAGGSVPEMKLLRINLGFDFGGLVTPELSLRYFRESQTNVNIEINGDFRNVGGFPDIAGQTLGGVEVSVAAEGPRGTLTLSGTVESFAIGGQELNIDDVTFSRPVDLDITRGVFDLKVRSNHVRDMAGAGIFLDEEALAVSVDIEGNHVTDCSGMPALASLTDAKGGLVIRNAALGRVRGNRISHCGNVDIEEGPRDAEVFAIDLEAVYDLTVADNYILQSNPSGTAGAVRLFEIFGGAGIRNNDILLASSRHGSSGLLASNAPREQGESPLPPPLVDLLKLYMRLRADNQRFIPSEQIHATFLGNRVRQQLDGFAILLDLFNLDHLNFTGNHITGQVGGGEEFSDAFIHWFVDEDEGPDGEGLLANNLLDGQVRLRVEGMARGVISGNVSPPIIPIVLSVSSPNVQHSLNDPQVDVR